MKTLILKYTALMAIGYFCYLYVINRKKAPAANFILSMAGFYAFDDGYEAHKNRLLDKR